MGLQEAGVGVEVVGLGVWVRARVRFRDYCTTILIYHYTTIRLRLYYYTAEPGACQRTRAGGEGGANGR